jgi:hypothetical protein
MEFFLQRECYRTGISFLVSDCHNRVTFVDIDFDGLIIDINGSNVVHSISESADEDLLIRLLHQYRLRCTAVSSGTR